MNKNIEWMVSGTTTSGETVRMVQSAWYGNSAIDFVAKNLGIKWQAVSAIKLEQWNKMKGIN